MRKILVVFLFSFSKVLFSCECPPSHPVTKELCEEYNVIFYGMVDSVSPCNTKGIATAYFTIRELYKGNSEKHTKVNFDCASECLMSFAKNEEWLIYANYEKFDELKVSLCEHNRKRPAEGEPDVYMIAAQRSFDQEKKFLNTTLGLHYFIVANDLNKQQEEMGPRNDQPSGWGKLILLLVSLLAMGIAYFILKKKK